jgi:tetratricopeptide (TPR) repeat protein
MKKLISIISSLALTLLSLPVIGQSSYYNEEAAHVIHGDNLVTVGNFEDAINAYTIAIDINPYYAKAYVRRADLYQKTGRSSQAGNDYRKALTLNPFSFELYRFGADPDRLRILAVNKQEGAPDAPETAEKFYLQAVDYLLNQKIQDALFAAEEAVRLSEREDCRYYKLLGNIHILMGTYKEAIRHFDRALNINPDYPEAIYNRGIAYILAFNPTQGCEDIQISIDKGLNLGVDKMRFICPRN